MKDIVKVVKVDLTEVDMRNLAWCMGLMDPMGADGKIRSITMPDTIREAIRRMATK